MRIGIMQPYFLPYLGYWQLMNTVDVYVVFDDVNYINGGWINRNRILVNGKPQYITVPLFGASQNKLINEIQVDTQSKLFKKQLRTVEMAYKKAPMFSEVFPMLETLFTEPKENLMDLILESFRLVRQRLNIHSKMILSSQIDKDNAQKGQDKIIAICKMLNADEYINAIGGKELYDRAVFEGQKIKLCFLKTKEISYPQFENAFAANLSVLDMMMFLTPDEISKLLNQFNFE